MVFPYFLNTKQAADHVRATFFWRWREHVRHPRLLPKDYRSLCPYFDHDVAETCTQDCHSPELTQVVFYAMVLNDAMALWVSCAFVADTLRWALECLNWGVFESWLETKGKTLCRAHNQRLAHPGANLDPTGSQEENSRSSDASSPSSDEE